MVKYNINYINENNKNINAIFINVLYKELKKFIEMTCKNLKEEVTSPHTYLSLKNKGSKN